MDQWTIFGLSRIFLKFVSFIVHFKYYNWQDDFGKYQIKHYILLLPNIERIILLGTYCLAIYVFGSLSSRGKVLDF